VFLATIEFLFIANHAEVQNGLLYASGVGWSNLYRIHPGPAEGQGPVNHFAIGASILVPWDETNQAHRLIVRVEREENETELSQVQADIEVGRPPGLSAGVEQRAVFGFPANIAFPEHGRYRVVAEIDGDTRSVGFTVHDLSDSQY
jgi:hypothetical protein